jgi:hypothetical protein
MLLRQFIIMKRALLTVAGLLLLAACTQKNTEKAAKANIEHRWQRVTTHLKLPISRSR